MRKLITNIEEVYALIPSWYDRRFAFDVETSGLSYLKDKLLGIALAFDDDENYYICLAHTMPSSEGDEHRHVEFINQKKLSRILSSLFRQEDVVMIAHNAKFDLHFLERSGMSVGGRLADTLSAAKLLDENRDNGLKALSADLLGMEYEKYQNMLHYKGFKKEEILGSKLEDVADYAMNDVVATMKLYDHFAPLLANTESKNMFGVRTLQDIYINRTMPLLPILQQMESRGIALDMELVKSSLIEQETIAKEHEKKFVNAANKLIVERYGAEIPNMYLKTATEQDLEDSYENTFGQRVLERDGVEIPIITHDMVGKTKSWRPRIISVNTGSHVQLKDIVYNLSGIELPEDIILNTSKATDEVSADRDNLETILFYLEDKAPPFIKDLLTWRKAQKFLTTYLRPFIEDSDEKDSYALHTSLTPDGAKTGRITSNSPNLLNIPSRGAIGKIARRLFVAREGYKLLDADYAQAELRMLAHYSMDPELLQAFAEGRDLHILTGSGFARMPYEELYGMYHEGNEEEHHKANELRQLGKTGNFALTYGMGAEKFRSRLIIDNGYEISVQEAREWIKAYNDRYKVATEWKRGKQVQGRREKRGGVEQHILRNGHVITLAGRYRRLPWAFSDDGGDRSYAIRQGINAIIQGSVGDIMTEAMIHIQPALKGLGGSLLLQIYDELVAEVPADKAEIGARMMEKMMVQYCNPYLRCQQKAECNIGDSWSDAKG